MYRMSYGALCFTASTLREARVRAKWLAWRMLYAVRIVANGDLVETWTPRVTRNRRVAFTRR